MDEEKRLQKAKENLADLKMSMEQMQAYSGTHSLVEYKGYNAMIQFYHGIKSWVDDDDWDEVALDFGLKVAPRIHKYLQTQMDTLAYCKIKKEQYEEMGEICWEGDPTM